MDTGTQIFLFVAVAVALAFEFVNGFHDTANAVATVIYTRSLPPRLAVLWSGIWNFLGVQLGGIAVAFAIVNLLPVDLVVSSQAHESRAMVLALLTSAILWNLLTWWKGLPASSSHALIGSILGVGVANAWMRGLPLSAGLNWTKVTEIGISLLFSPMVGFVSAAILLLVLKRLVPAPELHAPPVGDRPPPPLVRASLLATCTGVSFAHGSNDGQKGIGLIMLILISALPGQFALAPRVDAAAIAHAAEATRTVEQIVGRVPEVALSAGENPLSSSAIDAVNQVERRVHGAMVMPLAIADNGARVRRLLAGRASLDGLPDSDRLAVRESILRISASVNALEHGPRSAFSAADRAQLKAADRELRRLTDHAPGWVMLAVALALGLGTTVGWKRIVVTVGEKIGKSHLTYAQGASAELVAMSAIGLAGWSGMPVSTTHVLASGIAGTMAAQRSGLQSATLKSIALAWVLTLPVCMTLSAVLFPVFSAALR